MSPFDVESSALTITALGAALAYSLPAWQLSPESAIPKLVASDYTVACEDIPAFAEAREPVFASCHLQIHLRRLGDSSRTESGGRRAPARAPSGQSTPSDQARPGDTSRTQRRRRSRKNCTSEGTR